MDLLEYIDSAEGMVLRLEYGGVAGLWEAQARWPGMATAEFVGATAAIAMGHLARALSGITYNGEPVPQLVVS